MIEEYCQLDGRPMIRYEVDGEPRMKCLNEQETHYYHWPDKYRNSGWLRLSDEGEE